MASSSTSDTKVRTLGEVNFARIKAGQWVQPRRRKYYMQCCDCGLIHRFNFRIVKDNRGRNFIQFQAFRTKGTDTYHEVSR